jgi:hypothetical protein
MRGMIFFFLIFSSCSSTDNKWKKEGIASCRKADDSIVLSGDTIPKFDPNHTGLRNSKAYAEKFCYQGNKYYKNNPKYCYALGKMYEEKEHLACAMYWYKMGCNYNESNSCYGLRQLNDKAKK